MFSRKKKVVAEKKRRSAHPRSDVGFDIPGFSQNDAEDDEDLEAELYKITGQKSSTSDLEPNLLGEDDDDLEAELARIIGKSPKKPKEVIKSSPNVMPKEILNSDIKNIMADSVDEDFEGSDIDVDENDPDLLNELSMLNIKDESEAEESDGSVKEPELEQKEQSQVDIIRSRLEAYRQAEQKAKESKESSRARRFNRGVKTLEKCLKRVMSGEILPYDEIPPEIASNLKPASAYVPVQTVDVVNIAEGPHDTPPDQAEDSESNKDKISEPNTEDTPATLNESEPNDLDDPKHTTTSHPTILPLEPTTPVKNDPLLDLLELRRTQYKQNALAAKKKGDLQTALSAVKIVKVCDRLIGEHTAGRVIHESEVPKPPMSDFVNIAPVAPKSKPVGVVIGAATGQPGMMQAQILEVFTVPTTIQQALDQRLSYYKKVLYKLETSGKRVEARKCSDIVRIYENSIALHKKGKLIPFEKLPTPPGCPPIPLSFSMN